MITIQHLTALLPTLIVGATVVAVMLSIAWQRNSKVNAILSAIGLLIALFSCFWIARQLPISIIDLFKVDHFSLFYSIMVLIVSVVAIVLSYQWLKTYPDNKDELYLLLLIATLGGLILTAADHLLSLYIGIELLSLPMFGLIGYAYRRALSVEAALKYMLLSAAASTFLLMGIAFLYAAVGQLSFHHIGEQLSLMGIPPAIIVIGAGMVMIGIGFKLSIFPFQLWTPDVYQGAPSMVSMLLATTGKFTVFCVGIRFIMQLPIIEDASPVSWMLVLASLLTILFGNLLGILQRDIKRLLAFSSIAHIGYLLLILVTINNKELAIEATNVYFVGYMLSNIAAFGGLCLLSSPYIREETEDSNELKGLYWHRPWIAIAMSISFLSLAGIPLTLGFIGKFYLLTLGVYIKAWWIVGAIIIGSAFGLYYYLRITVNMFLMTDKAHVSLQKLKSDRARFCLSEWMIVGAGLLTLLLGLYPTWIINLANWAQISFL